MRERDRKGDERGKLSTEREEKVKIVMKNRGRERGRERGESGSN